VIFLLIVVFVLSAVIANINVYETFIEGAKDGFGVTIKIIPFLVGMLVAIGVFRASGAMREIVNGVAWIVGMLGFNTDFVDALPTAIMKPLSGSGARGMAVEAMQSYGVDSFVGRLACVFQGSTETTFYTLAVYFGAVGVRRTRYTVTCGLIADAAGIIAAIFVAYLFFH
ncbi:MAG: spore maturation protein, partial [Verrucomicrobiales bacterium]